MFETLLESKRQSEGKRALGVSVVSILMHTAIIAGAVYATLQAKTAATDLKVDTTVVLLDQKQQQKPPDQPPPPQVDVPLKGFQTVVAITDIPKSIPQVNLTEKFDPKDFSGVGVEGGVANGIEPTSNAVFSSDIVQEKPEVLSQPPLTYPPLLRQAGIQGVVTLRFIVDTTGRVERSSIQVVHSDNPGFNSPATDLASRMLFRPGRQYGRAVRVLVELPVNFTLTH